MFFFCMLRKLRVNETDIFFFHLTILDVAWVFLLPYFAANESFIYGVPLTCL